VNLAQLLQGATPGPTLRKEDILEAFRDTILVSIPPATDELLYTTIDFVSRLLLMVDIGPERPGDRTIQQLPVPWEMNNTLPDLERVGCASEIGAHFHRTKRGTHWRHTSSVDGQSGRPPENVRR
jgi:hypothetical protein